MNPARKAYFLLISLLGAVLIELLTENGIGHLEAVRTGTGDDGLFSQLNDRLYVPAALIAIAVIFLYMEKKKLPPVFTLIGVLIVATLVAWFGHLF